MVALIDRERRARAKRAKAERKRLLVAAGERAFMRFPYVEVSLDAIGRMAGVPQGKAEIYYGTREELFLHVFTAAAEQWFEDLANRLQTGEGQLQRSDVVEVLCASLEERFTLLRLLGLLPVVLEQNVDIVSGMIFIRKLKDGVERCGSLLEKRCQWLERGSGFEVLHRLQVYGASLYSVGYPTGSFAMMVQDDDLKGFQVDLGAELRYLTKLLVQ